jgi:hypothetical protein
MTVDRSSFLKKISMIASPTEVGSAGHPIFVADTESFLSASHSPKMIGFTAIILETIEFQEELDKMREVIPIYFEERLIQFIRKEATHDVCVPYTRILMSDLQRSAGILHKDKAFNDACFIRYMTPLKQQALTLLPNTRFLSVYHVIAICTKTMPKLNTPTERFIFPMKADDHWYIAVAHLPDHPGLAHCFVFDTMYRGIDSISKYNGEVISVLNWISNNEWLITKNLIHKQRSVHDATAANCMFAKRLVFGKQLRPALPDIKRIRLYLVEEILESSLIPLSMPNVVTIKR